MLAYKALFAQKYRVDASQLCVCRMLASNLDPFAMDQILCSSQPPTKLACPASSYMSSVKGLWR